MARPQKCRKVCCLPKNSGFVPLQAGKKGDTVILTVDEYETIRLIDKEALSQEECGRYMQIARTTVQQIYTSARKKLADALVDGLPLRIEGGNYRLCSEEHNDSRHYCGCHCCRKYYETDTGGNTMKIAMPLDENKMDVCVSFARAPYFLFCDGEKEEIVENPAAQAQGGAGLQAAQFLIDHGAEVLITVRCGQNAADVFQAASLEIKSDGLLYPTDGVVLDSFWKATLNKVVKNPISLKFSHKADVLLFISNDN